MREWVKKKNKSIVVMWSISQIIIDAKYNRIFTVVKSDGHPQPQVET